MARDFDGSTQYGSITSALATAAPLTLAGWFNTDSASGAQTVLCLHQNASVDNHFLLYFDGGTSSLRARANDGGSPAEATATGTITAGTWQHACGVFATSTSRSCYLDGAGKATNTTSKVPASVDRTFCGALNASNFFFNGKLMELGIWTAALDDNEVLSLARGVCPLMVRTASLVGYWPMIGNASPEPNYKGTAFTLTATPAKADHGRIMYPARGQFGKPTSGGAPAYDASLFPWPTHEPAVPRRSRILAF